jgi:hypothetical protein
VAVRLAKMAPIKCDNQGDAISRGEFIRDFICSLPEGGYFDHAIDP